jgi:EmrB/QacA subfamily drug resistance transporter
MFAKHRTLIAIGLIFFLLNIDLALVNIAIPTIANFFNASLFQVQCVLIGYIVTAAMFMALGGKLADYINHRLMFIIGVSCFTLGSLVIGLSFGITILIVGRIFQGLGIALMFPVSNVLAFESFPVASRGFVMGLLASITGFAQGLGPILAGSILHFANWRWIFLFNIPFGLLAIYLMWQGSVVQKPLQKNPIDFLGAVLLAIGLGTIMYTISAIENHGTDLVWSWLLLAVGLILLLCFIVWENRSQFPLLNIRLFKNRTFVVATIARAVFQFCYFSLLFIIVLLTQNIFGFSPLRSALIITAITMACGLTSPIAGKLIDKTGTKKPTLVALFTTSIVFFLLTTITLNTPLIFLLCLFMIIGTAAAILFTSCITAALAVVSEQERGLASGLFFTVALLSSSAGVTTTGAILLAKSAYQLQGVSLKVGLQNLPKAAFLSGFSEVMIVCGVLSLAALIIAMPLWSNDKK